MRKPKKLKYPFLCKRSGGGGTIEGSLALYNYLLSKERKEYGLLLSRNKRKPVLTGTAGGSKLLFVTYILKSKIDRISRLLYNQLIEGRNVIK